MYVYVCSLVNMFMLIFFYPYFALQNAQNNTISQWVFQSLFLLQFYIQSIYVWYIIYLIYIYDRVVWYEDVLLVGAAIQAFVPSR